MGLVRKHVVGRSAGVLVAARPAGAELSPRFGEAFRAPGAWGRRGGAWAR